MNKKVLFFDIDGTLAKGTYVPNEHYEALKQLKEKGHAVFICTGRPIVYAKKLFGNVADGFLTCNGRYSVYKDEVLVDYPMDKETIKKCDQILSEHAIAYEFDGSYHGYVKKMDDKYRKILYGEDATKYYIEKENLEEIKAYMFLFFFENEEKAKILENELSQYALLARHGGVCYDSTIHGFNKGLAIEEILKKLNFSKEDAYAFGDGGNDLPMFEHVSNCIAMGNAVDSLKEKATYITDSFDDLGLVKALEHFNLI